VMVCRQALSDVWRGKNGGWFARLQAPMSLVQGYRGFSRPKKDLKGAPPKSAFSSWAANSNSNTNNRGSCPKKWVIAYSMFGDPSNSRYVTPCGIARPRAAPPRAVQQPGVVPRCVVRGSAAAV
jgi:hypothetical protein